MAKTYGHKRVNGKLRAVDETLPRHLRGHSPDDVHTFKEGPIKRLMGRNR